MNESKISIAVHTFLLDADSVLLLRRCNTGYEDGNFGLVGGHLEGCESITQAAIRECREEVGVEVDHADLKVVGVAHYTSPTGEGIDFFLSTTRWKGDPHNPELNFCDELRWCPLNVLPESTIPFVRRAVELHLRAGVWYDEIGWQDKTARLQQPNESGERSSTEQREIARIAHLLEQTFEGKSYYGPSVLGALEGVTAEIALQKPRWSAHSIWELVRHITAELNYVHDVLSGVAGSWVEGETTWPSITETSATAWQKTIQDLKKANRALVKVVRVLDDAILDQQPIRVRGPFYLMLHGTIQHNVFHAGQISLLTGQMSMAEAGEQN